MATITKRFNRDGELIGWQAKIRRHGFPTQSKTFDRKTDADAWARSLEGEMDRGAFIDRRPAEQMTLADAIRHYLDAVAPPHKGADVEAARLGRFLREEPDLCRYALSNLRTHHIEDYRDRRLEAVAPGSLCREINPGTTARLVDSLISTRIRQSNPTENLKSTGPPPLSASGVMSRLRRRQISSATMKNMR